MSCRFRERCAGPGCLAASVGPDRHRLTRVSNDSGWRSPAPLENSVWDAALNGRAEGGHDLERFGAVGSPVGCAS